VFSVVQAVGHRRPAPRLRMISTSVVMITPNLAREARVGQQAGRFDAAGGRPPLGAC
jgi:hypothetical protein